MCDKIDRFATRATNKVYVFFLQMLELQTDDKICEMQRGANLETSP